MNPKLPYYMVYPMPLAYDDEKIERRDFEYMKSLYPDVAKKLLPYVEDECDRMEYDCSMMYDEYPDKLQLRMMGSRVYDKVKSDKSFLNLLIPEEQNDRAAAQETEMSEQAVYAPGRPPQGNRPPKPGRPPFDNRPGGKGNPDWLRDLIDVILYQELYRRRCNNRRCGRRFY